MTDTGTLSWYASGELNTLAVADSLSGSSDSQSCSYTHDDMGRLAGMSGGSCLWGQTYSLDPFGNVAKTASTGTSFSASFNLDNEISSVGSVSAHYDFNGNLLNDPVHSTTQVNTFDPDNKMVTLETVSVTYDALDRAVEAGSQEFAYAPDGSKIAVMSGQTLVRADIPLPGGGEAVYTASGLSYYRHADQLGSARLSTYANHTAVATAYAPFGEEETSSGAGYRSFTGKKQDIDSSTSGGQYDFPAREYSATQSRWWTPDPAGLAAVNPSNPQSWNRYAYVGGSPLGLRDPLGLQPCVAKLKIRRDETASGDEAASFGPYDDGSSTGDAADEDDCGSGGSGTCLVDGADVGCSLSGDMEAIGGGWGAGGSPSILASYQCLWSDCMGAANDIDQWGNPTLHVPGGNCSNGSAPNSFNCSTSFPPGYNGAQLVDCPYGI